MAAVRRSAVAAILSVFAALCDASTVLSSGTSTSQPTTTATVPVVTTALSAISQTTHNSAAAKGPITTAPVFLPYYDDLAWSALRGSILSSDDVKNTTTYTIFCRKEPKQACNLALDFPFIIIEGPKTVEFHGTYTSTFIADVGCALDGRTAATCSGYSSYKSGYKNGHVTGPTELSWTSTLAGTDVQWGVLTMAALPKPTGGDDDAADVNMAPTQNTALLFLPSDTPGAASTQAVQAWAAIVVAASTIFAGLLL